MEISGGASCALKHFLFRKIYFFHCGFTLKEAWYFLFKEFCLLNDGIPGVTFLSWNVNRIYLMVYMTFVFLDGLFPCPEYCPSLYWNHLASFLVRRLHEGRPFDKLVLVCPIAWTVLLIELYIHFSILRWSSGNVFISRFISFLVVLTCCTVASRTSDIPLPTGSLMDSSFYAT